MLATSISTKGQLTLPQSARDVLGLRAGDRLSVKVDDGDTIILKREIVRPFSSLRGILPKPNRAFSVEEMNAAMGAHSAQKHKAIKCVPISIRSENITDNTPTGRRILRSK